MDCKYCFYYTWEKALLCAVDPITAEHGDASNCRHFQHDPQYIVNGFVTMDSPELGFMVAIPLPYKWEDHYEGGLVEALVVTRDAYGFIRAVDIPDNNVYEEEFVDNEFDD